MKKTVTMLLTILMLVSMTGCSDPDGSDPVTALTDTGGSSATVLTSTEETDPGYELLEPSAEQKSANEKTVLEFASDKTGVEIMDELTYRSDETYSYAEALAEAEEFISLIESQGWTKKEKLVCVYEETGEDAQQSYLTNGEIIYIEDSSAWTEYSGEPSSADDPVFTFSKDGVAHFRWEFSYLAPRFSELSGQAEFDEDSEELFINSAKAFLEKYLPRIGSVNWKKIRVTGGGTRRTVSFYDYDDKDSFGRFFPVFSVSFHWDDVFALPMDGRGEKALLKDFTVFKPKGELLSAPVLGLKTAWKNACESENLDPQRTVVYDWKISYDLYNRLPIYRFLCSDGNSKKTFTVSTSAI